MKALVTGATGFIGKRLLRRIEQRIVLSRNADAGRKALAELNCSVYPWKPETEPAPSAAFEGVDAVFHLAGDPVAEGRWTAAKKAKLVDSRVLGTRNLVDTLGKLEHKPKVLVCASAVGYYSDRGDEELDERSPGRDDFLAQLCKDWEAEAVRARQYGMRVVPIRIGIVLGAGGGALDKMLLPFRLWTGSPLGSGKQWMPWIHVDDLADMMAFAAEHPSANEAWNGTAPNPVTNYEFTKTLGKTLGVPTFFPPVPGFALKLMFGEFGNILLHSQKVLPKAPLAAGFAFRHPTLEGALREILAPKKNQAA